MSPVFAFRVGCGNTPTTTFETFPFPYIPGQEPLDNPRYQAVLHQALDQAVCAAYGWDISLLTNDEAILVQLLRLNRIRGRG